jgi:osmoprotectant transport system substrate-binding protein
MATLLAVSTGGGSVFAQDDAPAVRIASQGFYEATLMAEIYAQALEANGIPVERLGGLGSRQERHASFESGLFDLFPEYVGSGHAIFDPAKATTDGEANARALEEAYAAAGMPVTVLGLTEGQDQNAAVVRQDTAAELGLDSLSDVAAVRPGSVGVGSAAGL